MSDQHVFMMDEEGYVYSVLLAWTTIALAEKKGLLPASSSDWDRLDAWKAAQS